MPARCTSANQAEYEVSLEGDCHAVGHGRFEPKTEVVVATARGGAWGVGALSKLDLELVDPSVTSVVVVAVAWGWAHSLAATRWASCVR